MLGGTRAAIHTASARLFVFSTAEIARAETPPPDVVVTGDRPVLDAHPPADGVDADLDEIESEREEPAQSDEELTPSASDRSRGGRGP
jgi:hypothetical protein